eukprot:scaffold25066_cov106-Isochrysis_galbana.AAC.4
MAREKELEERSTTARTTKKRSTAKMPERTGEMTHDRTMPLIGARLLVPDDAVRALGHNGHANEATAHRMRGRDGHLKGRGEQQPDADRADNAQVAVHQNGSVHVRFRVARGLSDAAADGLGDAAAGEDGASKLKDDGERARLLDG